MRNILSAILPRHRGQRLFASLMAGVMITPHAFAQAPANATVTRQDLQQIQSAASAGKAVDVAAIQQPLIRMTAAMTNAVLADNNAFEEEARAAEFGKLVSLEGLTPSSTVLDHCDRVTALVERANAIGRRYGDYVALARKQGEIEVAAHQLQPGDLAAFLDGTGDGRAGFEQRWAAAAGFVRETAALCTVLARRHWRVAPSGILEIEEPDLTEAQRLMQNVQQAAQRLVAIDQAREDDLKKRMEKIPSGQ